MDQNIDFFGSDQIQTSQYLEIHPPSQEYAQPEDSNELFQKLLKDLQIINKELIECNRPTFFDDNEDHSVQYKENLENSSNSNQEEEGPPQDFDIRQLIREECCTEEVKNVVEQPTECGTRIIESLQNYRVIHKNSISLKNTSQISSVHAIAPILSTKEPEYSPSMGYGNPNTTLKTKPDEIIKSGVEELVPILSENKVTSEDKRDDDDAFEDIEYVEALLPDPEIVSLAEENDVYVEEEEVDLEDIFQIQDVILREKLLSINRLIANIESLNDNPTPDRVLNSSFHFLSLKSQIILSRVILRQNSRLFAIIRRRREVVTLLLMLMTLFPSMIRFSLRLIPIRRLINVVKNDISDDSSNDPLLEEADLFIASDNSVSLGIKNFGYDSEGDIHFLEALLSDDSILLSNNESSESDFDNPSIPRPPPKPPDAKFDFEPDCGEEILVLMNTIDELKCIDPRDEFDDDDYSYFMFLICSEVFSFLSAESEDTIFDPGISV
nr:hypothetical protein [Tanacetum cinerariifolium]